MTSWTDRLGTQNPQFLRECRGRLKPRSVLAAVGLSLIFQFLLYISIAGLGGEFNPEAQRNVCQVLTWIIPYVLFVLGGFYIVDDLAREEKTGTLNFIRLSPRPAQEILLGKLLGVPLLPVVAAAIALPLHVISGLLGGVSALWFLSYYGILAFGTAFVYTLALLFGFVGSTSPIGKQQALSAIAFAGLALVIITPAFMTWNSEVTWWSFREASPLYTPPWNPDIVDAPFVEWLFLPIERSGLLAHLFTLINLAIGIFLTWRVTLRAFRMPKATLLSKGISYLIVAYLNVLVWGFFQNNSLSPDGVAVGGAVALFVLNVAIAFGLIFAIAPTRQTLIDWSRARWDNLFDWIWHDGSPSIVAVGINFVIAATLAVSWILLVDRGREIEIVPMLLAVASLGTCALIYATVVQLILSTKLRAAFVWAVGSVAVMAVVPPIVLATLDVGFEGTRSVLEVALWTFFGLPFWGPGMDGINVTAGIGLGWAMQGIVLLVLLTRLARRLKQLSSRQSVQV